MSTTAVTPRRLVRALVAAATVLWALTAVSAASLAAAPPAQAGQSAAAAEQLPAPAAQLPAEGSAPAVPAETHGEVAARGHGEAEGGGGDGHEESPWAVVARVFNFALLAGTLVYLLRSPLVGYLTQRGIQVRSELTKAATLRKEATAEVARVEAKMKAMPAEIEALKRRGAEEIVADEVRIKSLAESERRRLLEQATREIGSQLRLAERGLRKRAGELAVDLATARVKRTITDADQARLVERYVSQVKQ